MAPRRLTRSRSPDVPVCARGRSLGIFVRVRKNVHIGLGTAAIAIWLWSAIALAQPTAAGSEQPSAPPNLGLYKIELTRYWESGRYESGLAAVADQAKAWLTQRASRKGKLAMVLDIDETSLSNWPVIKADDFGFILSRSVRFIRWRSSPRRLRLAHLD